MIELFTTCLKCSILFQFMSGKKVAPPFSEKDITYTYTKYLLT